MTKEKLQNYIDNKVSTQKICSLEMLSQSGLKYYFRKYGLKTHVAERKHIPYHCHICGTEDVSLFNPVIHTACIEHYPIERKMKLIYKQHNFIELLGNKCNRCGYTGNILALTLSPHRKWNQERNNSWKHLIKHMADFEVVCYNCLAIARKYKKITVDMHKEFVL